MQPYVVANAAVDILCCNMQPGDILNTLQDLPLCHNACTQSPPGLACPFAGWLLESDVV